MTTQQVSFWLGMSNYLASHPITFIAKEQKTMAEQYIVEGENNENNDGWLITSSRGGVVYDFLDEAAARLICTISNDLLRQGIDPNFDDVEADYRWQMHRRIEDLEEQLKTALEKLEALKDRITAIEKIDSINKELPL